MDPIEFLVQGSASDAYRVVFKKAGNNFSAYCSCAAGEKGQFCKHRRRIMDGSTEGVISGNASEVHRVASAVEGTDVAAALAEVDRLERELENIKSSLTKAKKDLVRALYT